MKNEFFTEKQKGIIRLLKDNKLKRINILYGSVRSGKTWITLLVFALWVSTQPINKEFIMCAKTLTTLKRNCLNLLQDMVGETNFEYSISNKTAMLFGRKIYLEGANDSKAESKIRGMTLQGAYVDEVTLIGRDFFTMLLSRLSERNAKLFGSTNPDSPAHWLKVEYFDREDELNIFIDRYSIDDNTFLDPEYIKEIKSEYTGVFYERFINGYFAVAEGLIYPMYEEAISEPPEKAYVQQYVMSIDYGTQNAFAALIWAKIDDIWYAIDEYYYSGRTEGVQKTDEQYAQDIDKFTEPYRQGEKIRTIIDPSAASFIAVLRQRGKYRVMKADNAVLDGIRNTATAIQTGKIKISPKCKMWKWEAQSYVWADSEVDDVPVKVNDHCLTGDTLVMTEDGEKPIFELVGTSGYVWSYNTETGIAELKPFHDCRMTQISAKNIIELKIETGKKIRCTSDHLILTQNGWKQAIECVNERIITFDGNSEYVWGMSECGTEPVYNLEVADNHNFAISGGLIVHNCMDSARYFVQTMNIVKKKEKYIPTLYPHY